MSFYQDMVRSINPVEKNWGLYLFVLNIILPGTATIINAFMGETIKGDGIAIGAI